MGCLRLCFAFTITLFIAVIFTVVGTFLGTFITLWASAQSINFSSPLAAVQANPTGALVGGGIGVSIGLIVMLATIKRALNVNWLKKNGTRITATVSKIDTRRGTRQVPYYSNGRTQYRTEWYTYYVIIARWANPNTGRTHTFHSDNLSLYPKKYFPGCGIHVLIDPQKLDRYLVEV